MKNIQRVARDLGLPHIGWHTFRHSFARWAKDARMTLEDIKTLLRHATTKMPAEIYGGPELASTKSLQLES
jgi:integrase